MKKPELLAPAGNIESLKAAVLAGCDAVYIGGYMFGARSFASNFSNEELDVAVKYCHLYGVKIYVTTNTLVYENEVETFLEYIDFLHRINVDAVIIQDIGMMDLVRKTYPNLEIHASTQMHIHNQEGVSLLEKLGIERVVIARETSYKKIKEIKEKSNIKLEVFVHGALCISYSGQCLMSSLIGNRSGNRGTCAGSCRQKYDIFDENNKKLNDEEYLLSTKDLNSLEHIGELIEAGVDSFKIEGRMKSPSYVYYVISLYRKAIDSYLNNKKVVITELEMTNLKKIFNREFTKGFLFDEKNNDFTNSFRPNHQGVPIGKVTDFYNMIATVRLTDDLNLNDGIRIVGSSDDTGTIVTRMLRDKKEVTSARKGDTVSFRLKEEVLVNSNVLKTTDNKLTKQIEEILTNSSKKIKVDGVITIKKNKPIKLSITDGTNKVDVMSDFNCSLAENSPVTKEKVIEQISKLGNTVYSFDKLTFIGDEDTFVPIKGLNELRRQATDLLDAKRLYQIPYKKEEYKVEVANFDSKRLFNVLLFDNKYYSLLKYDEVNNIYIRNKELYNKVKDNKKTILALSRVQDDYIEDDSIKLVGELGSINKYKNCITDYSFNVVNSYSAAFLHSLDVDRVTLSYELDDMQIKQLIMAYKNRYDVKPNLEMIVYAKEEVMISKFNLLDYFSLKDHAFLKDRFNNLYPIIRDENRMNIFNYKARNLTNYNFYFEMGINYLRFQVIDDEDYQNLKNNSKKSIF